MCSFNDFHHRCVDVFVFESSGGCISCTCFHVFLIQLHVAFGILGFQHDFDGAM